MANPAWRADRFGAKLFVAIVLGLAGLFSEGCGGNQQPQPGPVPPVTAGTPRTPGPTVPPPVPPLPGPTVNPTPTPLPPVPPPRPKCSIEVTRATVLEVCGYVACPPGTTTTAPINVVLEGGAVPGGTVTLGTPQTPGIVLGGAIPANLPATLLEVPGVPPGSENRAFRFELTQPPIGPNPQLVAGAPVTVAIPAATAGQPAEARSRVVFLQAVRALKPHIVEATTEYIRGFVGVTTAVTVSSIELQLFGITRLGDPAGRALIPIGASRGISVSFDTPPWAPPTPAGLNPGQLPPVAMPGSVPGGAVTTSAGAGATTTAAPGMPAPFPYPYPPLPGPFPPTGQFRPVWFECALDRSDPAVARFVQPGRRVILMATAAGLPRAFSRRAIVKQGPTAHGFEVPFRVLAAGLNCQGQPGTAVARNPQELRALVRNIGRREVGPFPTPAFPAEAVVGICLPPMPNALSAAVVSVRFTGNGLELRITYRGSVTPPRGAGRMIRPWVLLAVPTNGQPQQVQVVEEPTQDAPQ